MTSEVGDMSGLVVSMRLVETRRNLEMYTPAPSDT